MYTCAEWSSRSRQGERFAGALSAVKAHAPIVAGNFGVWGGLLSTFECAARGLRQKEDSWNPIISGFMTGGCLAVRSAFLYVLFDDYPTYSGVVCILAGPKAALQSAIACGILLGVFEGVGIVMGRFFSEGQRPQQAPCECIYSIPSSSIIPFFSFFLFLSTSI